MLNTYLKKLNQSNDTETKKIVFQVIDCLLKEIKNPDIDEARVLNDIEIKLQSHIKNFDSFDNEIKRLTNLCNIYSLHLEENSKICDFMERYNLKLLNEISEELQTQEEGLKQRLNIFDEILKNILQELDKTREKVKKLQTK